MNEKKAIKVVKRAERDKQNVPESARSTRERSQKTARDMVTTVSSWVNDVQRKRREETVEAVNSLLRARQFQAES
jgi:hypothetical protein